MSRIKDFIEMTKPRLSAMAVFSGSAGYIMARDPNKSFFIKDNLFELIILTIGLSFVGAASNVVNMWQWNISLTVKWIERPDRPIPTGRVKKNEAMIFGHVCLVIGLSILFYFFRKQVGYLALFTYISYVFMYTPMKTRTALNTMSLSRGFPNFNRLGS